MYFFRHMLILFGIVVTSCIVSAQFNERLPLKGISERPKPNPATSPVIDENSNPVEVPPKKIDFFTQKGKQPTQFLDQDKKKPGKRPFDTVIPDKIVVAPLTPDRNPITPPPGGIQNPVHTSIIIVPDLECEEGFAYDENGTCREVW